MTAEILAGELLLRPLTTKEAHEIVITDRLPEPLFAGDGWPHDDSYDGLGMASDEAYAWLVTLKGAVIGECGTLGGVDAEGAIEIGYGLAAPYRHRGYGSMLVRPLADFLRAQPGVRCVVAETRPDNRASYRALERAGFRRISATETALRYALP